MNAMYHVILNLLSAVFSANFFLWKSILVSTENYITINIGNAQHYIIWFHPQKLTKLWDKLFINDSINDSSRFKSK